MPAINLFIDKKIYDKIIESIKNGLFPNEQEFIQTSILLMVKLIDLCKESKEGFDKCVEKIIFDLIFK